MVGQRDLDGIGWMVFRAGVGRGSRIPPWRRRTEWPVWSAGHRESYKGVVIMGRFCFIFCPSCRWASSLSSAPLPPPPIHQHPAPTPCAGGGRLLALSLGAIGSGGALRC